MSHLICSLRPCFGDGLSLGIVASQFLVGSATVDASDWIYNKTNSTLLFDATVQLPSF